MRCRTLIFQNKPKPPRRFVKEKLQKCNIEAEVNRKHEDLFKTNFHSVGLFRSQEGEMSFDTWKKFREKLRETLSFKREIEIEF